MKASGNALNARFVLPLAFRLLDFCMDSLCHLHAIYMLVLLVECFVHLLAS